MAMSIGTFAKSRFICSPLHSRRPIDFFSLPHSSYKLASANKKPKFLSRRITVFESAMESEQSTAETVEAVPNSSIKLLFVEMGVGYDQHGQDITSAAMRACRDAISSNSIPAFRRSNLTSNVI